MGDVMHIHRVVNDGKDISINHGDAEGLVSIGVLTPTSVDRIAPGFVVHYYRKAD